VTTDQTDGPTGFVVTIESPPPGRLSIVFIKDGNGREDWDVQQCALALR
jgi:hypothetical protein